VLVISVIRTAAGESEMHTINKIMRIPLGATGNPVEGNPEKGKLVFDPHAPDTLYFEGKNETLVMGPIREVTATKGLVRIKYGEPPAVRIVGFNDLRAGYLKAGRQGDVLAQEIKELARILPLTDKETESYDAQREGDKFLEAVKKRKAAQLRMWIFGIIVLLGSFATFISYSSVGSSGRYYVFWGAMVFGGLFFIVAWLEYAQSGKVIRGRTAPIESNEKAPNAASVGLDDIADLKERGDVDSLVAALGVDEFEIRIQAMDALRDLQHPRALDLLIERLTYPRWDVRWSAAEALGKLGNPQAIEALTRCLSDENAMVRAVAEDAIRALQSK
jgi:HEAT repeat protein